MGRRHPVAAIVKDAAGEKRTRPPQPDPPRRCAGRKLGLHGVEQIPIHDGVVLPRMDPAAVDDLPNIKSIAQQMGEGADAEANHAERSTGRTDPALGADASAIKILDQKADRAEREIAFEDQADGGGFLGDDNELLVDAGVA
jgi:hypothetical protein